MDEPPALQLNKIANIAAKSCNIVKLIPKNDWQPSDVDIIAHVEKGIGSILNSSSIKINPQVYNDIY